MNTRDLWYAMHDPFFFATDESLCAVFNGPWYDWDEVSMYMMGGEL